VGIQNSIQQIKYCDLFAGVGGFHLGIDNVNKYGIENATTSTRSEQGLSKESEGSSVNDNQPMATQQFTCVYSNEWDKYANSVYKKHYGECDSRDIREVKAEELPKFDLLCSGFPCQSFSVAGKRGGFDDTRGTLFFEIARILKEKKPRYLLLENVKGLLSHDRGRTFETIIGVLTNLGYGVQWQVLNSKDFGVSQNRERVFIVGHFRGTSRPQVFPILGKNKAVAQSNEVAIPVLTPDRVNKRQNGRRFKTNSEPSFTLTKQDKHGIYNGVNIRRFTPIECERLQGFPDNY